MPGTPALDKVLAALAAVFAAEPGTTDIDRPEDDGYGKGEIPARNIIDRGETFTEHSQNETLHVAAVDIDHIVAVEASATNGAQLREMEARTVELLWADRTLGGLVQEIIWTGNGGAIDVHANQGARTLSIQILFLTPVGDHRTVIGAAGLIP